MYVNFEKSNVRFAINGVDYGINIAYDNIKYGSYRLASCLNNKNQKLQLVSYSNEKPYKK